MDYTDPLRSHRFTVEINGEVIGIMGVTGLSRTAPGSLELTRGFTSAETRLRDWSNDINQQAPPKEIRIVVDGRLTFEFKECRPLYLSFSELDAGSNKVFTESLEVSYARVVMDW
jgi:hypothetical protein